MTKKNKKLETSRSAEMMDAFLANKMDDIFLSDKTFLSENKTDKIDDIFLSDKTDKIDDIFLSEKTDVPMSKEMDAPMSYAPMSEENMDAPM